MHIFFQVWLEVPRTKLSLISALPFVMVFWSRSHLPTHCCLLPPTFTIIFTYFFQLVGPFASLFPCSPHFLHPIFSLFLVPPGSRVTLLSCCFLSVSLLPNIWNAPAKESVLHVLLAAQEIILNNSTNHTQIFRNEIFVDLAHDMTLLLSHSCYRLSCVTCLWLLIFVLS